MKWDLSFLISIQHANRILSVQSYIRSKNAYLKWVYPIKFGALGMITVAYLFNGLWNLFSILFFFNTSMCWFNNWCFNK